MASTILSDNGVTSGSAGLKTTAASDGALALQTTTAGGTATTALTIDTSQNVTLAGTITTTGITNSGVATATRFNPTGSSVTGNGMYLPAANSLGLSTNGTNAVYIDSSQRVGIGVTTPAKPLSVYGGDGYVQMLNASTGTATGDGSFIGVEGGTTALRIVNQENDVISFSTNGLANERMRIDTSGRLLIGTTSASYGKLVISGASADVAMQIADTASTTAGIGFNGSGSTNGVGAPTGTLYFGQYNGFPMVFTNNNAERMRIDSSGNLLVGTTSNYGTARTSINNSGTVLGLYCSGASGATGMVIGKASNDASTAQVLMQFLYNNGSAGLGQINGNGGSQAAFGSYSDIRLKENIVNIPSQLQKICDLRPVEFDYKDGSGHQTGFIAQEMQEVYPDAVAVGQNEMLTVTGWNKTEAYLVKAIQELKAINDTQAETINALTARIVALEQA